MYISAEYEYPRVNKQFPSIFLSLPRASIKNKGKPKSDKVLQQNKKTTIFLPKINKAILKVDTILEPNIHNIAKSGRKVRLGQHFFENNSLDEPKKAPSSTRIDLFRNIEIVENAKW